MVLYANPAGLRGPRGGCAPPGPPRGDVCPAAPTPRRAADAAVRGLRPPTPPRRSAPSARLTACVHQPPDGRGALSDGPGLAGHPRAFAKPGPQHCRGSRVPVSDGAARQAHRPCPRLRDRNGQARGNRHRPRCHGARLGHPGPAGVCRRVRTCGNPRELDGRARLSKCPCRTS